jgi:hypothetical protein
MPRKRILYTTTQVDIADGQQLRISLGRRTVFVYANRRGLHVVDGGYKPKPTGSPPVAKRPKQMDLPL